MEVCSINASTVVWLSLSNIFKKKEREKKKKKRKERKKERKKEKKMETKASPRDDLNLGPSVSCA